MFANWRFHTHSKAQTHAFSAMSGASDYAVTANQFPVFHLMDAIIFMDLKQVRMPPPLPQLDTHVHTLNKVCSLNPLARYGFVKNVKIYVMIFSIWPKRQCECVKGGFGSLILMITSSFGECVCYLFKPRLMLINLASKWIILVTVIVGHIGLLMKCEYYIKIDE